MEIGLKLCNGNLKEWELTVWEWDGMRIKSLFPVISSVNAALRITYEARRLNTRRRARVHGPSLEHQYQGQSFWVVDED